MEKIPDSSDASKRYEGIRLYRDDIDLIVLLLKENGCKIEIVDMEFKFESLDELMEKRGIKPPYFKIYGRLEKDGSISMIFEKNKLSVYSYGYTSDSNIIKIIFSKLRDILEIRYSRLYKIFNPWIYLLPLIVIFSLYSSSYDKNKPIYLFLLIFFGLAWIYCLLFRNMFAGVSLQRKHQGGFWKRNADKLFLLIMGAIVGIVIKYIWEKIIK